MAESDGDIEMHEEETAASSSASTYSFSWKFADTSIFGHSCVLSELKLPTKKDVLRRTFLEYSEARDEKKEIVIAFTNSRHSEGNRRNLE